MYTINRKLICVCILFLELPSKSPVEESKKVVTAESNKVPADAPAKETPNAVEKMDIDTDSTKSIQDPSTKSTSDVPATVDPSKVELQTSVGKKTVGTSVKTNLESPKVATPTTKVVTVSSSQGVQTTGVQITTAVGNRKLVSTASQAANLHLKTTPVQTVTLVSTANSKAASPLVKSASPLVKSIATPRVVSNQPKIPGVSLYTNVVAHNGLSSLSNVLNKSTSSKSEEVKKELPLFKLGMEKSYEQYVNQFSSNQLAKNKQHAQEERDRRRGISTKFNLAEYNYTGSLIGNLERILLTLRCSIVTLETSIPTAFMHPMWPVQRSTWVKAVHMSKSAPEFASVLAFFEGFIKPVVMRGVWNDAVGHLEFFRNLTESKTATNKKSVKDEEEEHRNIELIGKSRLLGEV